MTIALGYSTTRATGRRVAPIGDPATAQVAAPAWDRLTIWLQGRSAGGITVRGQDSHPGVRLTAPLPRCGPDNVELGVAHHPRPAVATESVWGKVCGCACG